MKGRIIFIVTIIVTVVIARGIVNYIDELNFQKRVRGDLMDAYHESVTTWDNVNTIDFETIDVEEIQVETIN